MSVSNVGHLYLFPSSQPEQVLEWHNCVKIAICFNEWRQMSIIDERHFRRHAFGSRHGLYFAIDLSLDLSVDLPLALDLHKPKRTPGLQHKINLNTRLAPRAFRRTATIGTCGCYQCVGQVHVREKHPVVVHDKVFKRQAQHRVDSFELGQRRKEKCTLIYHFLVGFYELEIEAGVVIPEAKPALTRQFAGLWIARAFLRSPIRHYAD